MIGVRASVLLRLRGGRTLTSRSGGSFGGAAPGSEDAATPEDIRKYSEVVCEEVKRIHQDYASNTDPELYSKDELAAQVHAGVSQVRRRYVGLPREAQEAEDAWAQEVRSRIQRRNSARFRDDVDDRSQRQAAKSQFEKEQKKRAEHQPKQQYEVVQR